MHRVVRSDQSNEASQTRAEKRQTKNVRPEASESHKRSPQYRRAPARPPTTNSKLCRPPQNSDDAEEHTEVFCSVARHILSQGDGTREKSPHQKEKRRKQTQREKTKSLPHPVGRCPFKSHETPATLTLRLTSTLITRHGTRSSCKTSHHPHGVLQKKMLRRPRTLTPCRELRACCLSVTPTSSGSSAEAAGYCFSCEERWQPRLVVAQMFVVSGLRGNTVRVLEVTPLLKGSLRLSGTNVVGPITWSSSHTPQRRTAFRTGSGAL